MSASTLDAVDRKSPHTSGSSWLTSHLGRMQTCVDNLCRRITVRPQYHDLSHLRDHIIHQLNADRNYRWRQFLGLGASKVRNRLAFRSAIQLYNNGNGGILLSKPPTGPVLMAPALPVAPTAIAPVASMAATALIATSSITALPVSSPASAPPATNSAAVPSTTSSAPAPPLHR